ncbi:MAG: glycoside hydrolase family 16 protein [Bacteroidota bacterium]
MKKVFFTLFITANIVLVINCGSKKEDNPNPTTNTNTTTPVVMVDPITVNSCGINPTIEDLAKENWTNIWKEDFDTNLKDWKKWIGGAFNGEYQYYNGETNTTVKDGMLTITPKREFITGLENPFSNVQKSFNFTSARIESGMKFSPNGVNYKSLRISARVKTPAGIGMWPAFWVYGDAWPTNGEIDILEQDGGKPKEYSSTYHYGTSVNADQWIPSEVSSYKSDTDITTCWHIFECIWEKDRIAYLFDGKEYFQNTGRNVPAMFDKLQNIAINLAVGGNYVGNPPPESIQLNPMYVDWVRVFAK